MKKNIVRMAATAIAGVGLVLMTGCAGSGRAFTLGVYHDTQCSQDSRGLTLGPSWNKGVPCTPAPANAQVVQPANTTVVAPPQPQNWPTFAVPPGTKLPGTAVPLGTTTVTPK